MCRAVALLLLAGVTAGCGGVDDVEAGDAAARLAELMGPDTFGDELTVEPRTCPLGDSAQLFERIAQEIDDDFVAKVARDGLPASLLLSIPQRQVSVATCQVSIPEAPLDYVRLEVRPGSESIDALTEVMMEPDSVDLELGDEYRGGRLYRYCGTRPGSDIDACVSGWRNADIDIALAVNGLQARLVDVDGLEGALMDILDDVVSGLGR